MSAILKLFASRKLLYVLLSTALSGIMGALQHAHPEWVLPSAEQVLALGAGLIGCHTLTDVIAIVKDAIMAYAQTPRTSPTSAFTDTLGAVFKEVVKSEVLKLPTK